VEAETVVRFGEPQPLVVLLVDRHAGRIDVIKDSELHAGSS
jgi:hypothetical protein